jgi:Rod binding domain-containing protein
MTDLQINAYACRTMEPHPNVVDPRLKRAAQSFEAMMMKELLAPLSQEEGLGGADGTGGGTLKEFASESLARTLSAAGGLGLADRIAASLSRSGNSPETNCGNRKDAN